MKKIISICLLLALLLSCSSGAFAYSMYPSGDGKIIVCGDKNPDRPTGLLVYSSDGARIVSIGQAPEGDDEFEVYLSIGAAADGGVYRIIVDASEPDLVKNISSSDALYELNAASDASVGTLAERYKYIFDFDISALDALYDKAPAYTALADTVFTEAQAGEQFLSAIQIVINNEKDTALAMIADGKADTAISRYINHFDVDTADFASVKTKQYVYNFLNGNTYTNYTDFESAFADAILVANINDASGDDFVRLVRASQAKIGLDLSADAQIPDSVFAKADKRPAKNFEALQTIFKEEIALNKLNTAAIDDVKAVIEAEDNVLNLLSTPGYSALSEEQKTEVCKAMAGGNYATVEAVRTEFAAVTNRTANPQIPQLPPSPGGSTTGGGVSISGGASSGGSQITPSGSSLPFADLSASHWGYEAISSLYGQKIVSGTSETTFEPEREVTREEFVKMLVGTFGLFNVSAKNVFTDVPDDHWSLKFVASACEKGLTLGREDGSFGIGEILTRQDMATLAARCAQIAGFSLEDNADITFTDESAISAYALGSVYTLAKAGIINGVGGSMFSPYAGCTRAMAAKVCNELLKLYQGGVIR